jgi:hypothetical protein
MKVGDLIRMPQNQGLAIVYAIECSKPGEPHHPYSTAIVSREWGLDAWDADACVVVNESR